MNNIIIRGRILEYESIGDGFPLIFLHGLGGGIGQITAAIDPPPGVRLIIPNQQAHGASGADWSTFGFSSLCDDVLRLMDRLQLSEAALAGISMGAAVSLGCACRFAHRVRGLFLVRNAWTDHAMQPHVVTAYHDLGSCLQVGGREAFLKTEGAAIVCAASAYTRTTFLSTFDQPDNVRTYQKFLILPTDTPVDSPEAIASVRMPVTILANRNDLCHPFHYGEYLHRLIAGSEFYELPPKDEDGSSHRRLMNLYLQQWLAQLQAK